MIVTGAAPASPTVLGFLRAALGCQVGSRGCSEGFVRCQLGNALLLRAQMGEELGAAARTASPASPQQPLQGSGWTQRPLSPELCVHGRGATTRGPGEGAA